MRRLGLLAVAVTILGVAIFAGASISRWYFTRELGACESALRASGVALTLDELNTLYDSVCSANEAASLYKMAFAEVDECASSLAENIQPETVPWLTDVDLGILHAALSPNRRALELLREATRFPCARFSLEDVNLTLAPYQPNNLDAWPMRQLRHTPRLWSLAAMEALASGDSALAMTYVEAMIVLARQIALVPSSDAIWVCRACLDSAERLLVTGMRHGLWTFDDLQQAVSILTDCNMVLHNANWGRDNVAIIMSQGPPVPAMRMMGEEALAELLSLDRDDATAIGAVIGPLVDLLGATLNYARYDLYVTVPFMRAELACARVPRALSYRESHPRIEEAAKLFPIATATSLLWGIRYRLIAEGRLLQAACVIERGRLEGGGYPTSLDNQVTSEAALVLTDPFDGARLRYRTEREGFVVYSVGENLTDDGGKTWSQDYRELRDDITLDLSR